MTRQVDSDVPGPRLSAVVPASNEARSLPRVFARIPADVDEVIFLSDHAVDDTLEVAPGRACAQPSGKRATQRKWTPGKGEMVPLHSHVPPMVTPVRTT